MRFVEAGMVRRRGAGTEIVREGALLTAGAVLLALSVDLFLVPSDLAPGGVSGLAIILRRLIGTPVGLTMLLLNLPMLVLGYARLGRFRFLLRTAFVVLLYNLGVDILARWTPAGGLTQDLLLNALFGGVVGGIGTGLVFRGRGTSAGTGVVSRIMQLRTGVPISQVYLITDGAVVLLAGIVFGWEKALYALITLFVWGLAADYVLEGPSTIRTVFIVTDEPDAVARAVLNGLGIGVTTWPAQGEFTGAAHAVLFCTVGRPDVSALRSIVTEADDSAFIVVGQGHQASGGVVRPRPGPAPAATQERRP
jgi:uncharacterized membrane-anchored protein YitT (DUF2179 family)